MSFDEYKYQVQRARTIKASLGVRIAAGYLRNKGWPIRSAVAVLCVEAK